MAAAGGAGYVAKNMMAAPPPEVIVEQGPQAPSIELSDVLVLTGDVPMGARSAISSTGSHGLRAG